MATMLAYLPPAAQALKNSARDGVSRCCLQADAAKYVDNGKWSQNRWSQEADSNLLVHTYEDLCNGSKIVLELIVSVDDGATNKDLRLGHFGV